MGSKLSYFEVTSPDTERSQSSYREMFGWQVMALPEMGGNLAAGLARAVELGGTVVPEPTEIPGFGTIAVFADPAGHQVGLWDRDGFGAA